MKRFALIMLHTDTNTKILYDWATGKYLRSTESPTGRSNYTWLIFQPLAIFGLEILGEKIAGYSGSYRLIMGLLLFLVLSAVCTVSWELFLYYYGNHIVESSVQVPEPAPSTLSQWAVTFPDRIRKAHRLEMIFLAVIAILIVLFLVTGIPLFLTIALCGYSLMYFIMASARPGLLKKYMDTKVKQ